MGFFRLSCRRYRGFKCVGGCLHIPWYYCPWFTWLQRFCWSLPSPCWKAKSGTQETEFKQFGGPLSNTIAFPRPLGYMLWHHQYSLSKHWSFGEIDANRRVARDISPQEAPTYSKVSERTIFVSVHRRCYSFSAEDVSCPVPNRTVSRAGGARNWQQFLGGYTSIR